MGCDEAQNVNDCTSTSSPGPTPQASSAKCTAAVPALRQTTRFSLDVVRCTLYEVLTKCSRSFSKAFTLGPIGTTQLVSKASLMKSCSLPLMWARQR